MRLLCPSASSSTTKYKQSFWVVSISMWGYEKTAWNKRKSQQESCQSMRVRLRASWRDGSASNRISTTFEASYKSWRRLTTCRPEEKDSNS
jgi:hypothetical protein